MVEGFCLVNLNRKTGLDPIITAFLPLAMSSQDSLFSQERSTGNGEVAALRLTARSQVSVSFYWLLKFHLISQSTNAPPSFQYGFSLSIRAHLILRLLGG